MRRTSVSIAALLFLHACTTNRHAKPASTSTSDDLNPPPWLEADYLQRFATPVVIIRCPACKFGDEGGIVDMRAVRRTEKKNIRQQIERLRGKLLDYMYEAERRNDYTGYQRAKQQLDRADRYEDRLSEWPD